MINSNYGYYVFKKKTQEGKSQLQWVRENIIENQETRQAVININEIEHKKPTKDFPCTLGLVFHIDKLENTPNDLLQQMPYIIDAELTLDDINKITELRPKTDVIKWILENKE